MINKIPYKIILKYRRLGLKVNHWHGILINDKFLFHDGILNL